MTSQILIDNDPFYITERLRDIDENYFLVFNNIKHTFELHNSSQKDSTFALTLPFDCLDERTVFLARKTRKQNFDKLIDEMDSYNDKLKKNLLNHAIDQIKEVL